MSFLSPEVSLYPSHNFLMHLSFLKYESLCAVHCVWHFTFFVCFIQLGTVSIPAYTDLPQFLYLYHTDKLYLFYQFSIGTYLDYFQFCCSVITNILFIYFGIGSFLSSGMAGSKSMGIQNFGRHFQISIRRLIFIPVNKEYSILIFLYCCQYLKIKNKTFFFISTHPVGELNNIFKKGKYVN